MRSLKHDASNITPDTLPIEIYSRVFNDLPEHVIVPLLYVIGVLVDTLSTIYVIQHPTIFESNPVIQYSLTNGWVGILFTKTVLTLSVFLLIFVLIDDNEQLTLYYVTTAFLGIVWFLFGVWNLVLLATVT